MKRLLIIIFTTIAILSIYARDWYYHDGRGIQHLTIDSSTVVLYENTDSKIPAHFEFEKSLGDNYIKLYHVRLLKNRYNLSDNKQFPKELALMPCYRDAKGEQLIPTGGIDVMLKKQKDSCYLFELSKKLGLKVVDNYMTYWYYLRLIPGNGLNSIDIANKLYSTGRFECAIPEFHTELFYEISYDARVHEQWALYNKNKTNKVSIEYDISISEAWNFATGRGVKIAIIDDGVDTTHEDLSDNMLKKLSYDAESRTSPCKVYDEHGTFCAGIAAAVRNNGKFISGVAPDAKIMPVSIENGVNKSRTIADGINWAWRHGADVISCSWGISKNQENVKKAIDSALTYGRNGKGCVVVKSAGNKDTITFPGNLPGVITVANITAKGTIGASCSKGDNMFIAAPGTDIISTLLDNRVGQMSGTSMAAAHVAGVAALILQRNPDLTADGVRSILAHSADTIGPYNYDTIKTYGPWNRYYGYGLVNAANAVKRTPRKE